jgi:hypothetical protein
MVISIPTNIKSLSLIYLLLTLRTSPHSVILKKTEYPVKEHERRIRRRSDAGRVKARDGRAFVGAWINTGSLKAGARKRAN